MNVNALCYCPLCTPGICLLQVQLILLTTCHGCKLLADLSWAWNFSAVIFNTNACIHTANCLWREKSANVNVALPAWLRWRDKCGAAGQVLWWTLEQRPLCAHCLVHMQLRDVRCIVISSSLALTKLEVAVGRLQVTGLLLWSLSLLSPPVCLIHTPLSWFWSAPSQQLMSYQDPK